MTNHRLDTQNFNYNGPNRVYTLAKVLLAVLLFSIFAFLLFTEQGQNLINPKPSLDQQSQIENASPEESITDNISIINFENNNDKEIVEKLNNEIGKNLTNQELELFEEVNTETDFSL